MAATAGASRPPIALTIAGSDSGGGAGIQADLKTFHQHRVFGTTVITAVTAQNTLGVTAWTAVAPDLVRAQLDAVAEDLRPAAIKSGMLGERDVVRVVAEGIARHRLRPYVLDPVMVATSGDLLLTPEAVDALRDALAPLATLITPNLDEAALLLGRRIERAGDMPDAARDLAAQLRAPAVLLKGGHLRGDDAVDVLFDGTVREFRHQRLDTTSTHGTGCTLSSAIAARLARGESLEDAVARALDWVHRAIASAPTLGRGHGPLDHWTTLP